MTNGYRKSDHHCGENSFMWCSHHFVCHGVCDPILSNRGVWSLLECWVTLKQDCRNPTNSHTFLPLTNSFTYYSYFSGLHFSGRKKENSFLSPKYEILILSRFGVLKLKSFCLFSDWEGAGSAKSPIREEQIALLEGKENFEEWLLYGQNSVSKWRESTIFIWTSIVYWVY